MPLALLPHAAGAHLLRTLQIQAPLQGDQTALTRTLANPTAATAPYSQRILTESHDSLCFYVSVLLSLSPALDLIPPRSTATPLAFKGYLLRWAQSHLDAPYLPDSHLLPTLGSALEANAVAMGLGPSAAAYLRYHEEGRTHRAADAGVLVIAALCLRSPIHVISTNGITLEPPASPRPILGTSPP